MVTGAGSGNTAGNTAATTKSVGDGAEALALTWLQSRGLTLLRRNYRVARGPYARGGEVDLILREADGTLVFVEVRARASRAHGGAAASVTPAKQRRVLLAAQHYLLSLPVVPPCRFDVLAIDGGQVQWLQAAFDLS
ncbi:MAG: YraN family protein [Chitinophagaceae bacterium]|nr:YraN family protein [Rubrivivax sp.]